MLRFSLTFLRTRLMRVRSELMSKAHHLLHPPVLLALHVLLDSPVYLVEDAVSLVEGRTYLDSARTGEDEFDRMLPGGDASAPDYRDLETLVELVDPRDRYRPDTGAGQAAVLVGERRPPRLDLYCHRAHGVDRSDPVRAGGHGGACDLERPVGVRRELGEDGLLGPRADRLHDRGHHLRVVPDLGTHAFHVRAAEVELVGEELVPVEDLHDAPELDRSASEYRDDYGQAAPLHFGELLRERVRAGVREAHGVEQTAVRRHECGVPVAFPGLQSYRLRDGAASP